MSALMYFVLLVDLLDAGDDTGTYRGVPNFGWK
jgi:hypothetical protein